MAGIKRISWGRKITAWERSQAWRQRRAYMVQSYMADANSASAGLQTAVTNAINGSARLATEAALKRITEATQAKFDEIAKVDVTV
jgi:hypothetical protein